MYNVYTGMCHVGMYVCMIQFKITRVLSYVTFDDEKYQTFSYFFANPHCEYTLKKKKNSVLISAKMKVLFESENSCR